MDLMSLFIILAVVVVGLLAVAGFVHYSHSKLATSLRADINTAATTIKPAVATFDASALADIHLSLDDLHAKVDAITAHVVPEAKAVFTAAQTELTSKLRAFEALGAEIRALLPASAAQPATTGTAAT